MKLKCLITCKIENETYKSGEIYELPDIIAHQQIQSSEYFKSVNKLHRVFFENIDIDNDNVMDDNVMDDNVNNV